MTSIAAIRLAATALPLRHAGTGFEVLMVLRNPELAFGGKWTFPGGALDPGDGVLPDAIDEDGHDWAHPELVETAARAAARETREETGLECRAEDLIWFSHWIPPRRPGFKRFATWFFIAPEPAGELVVDLTENSDARWITPVDALAQYDAGSFPLAVPTWVTLDDLQGFSTPEDAEAGARRHVRLHHTQHVTTDAAPVLLWSGDAAHGTGDLDAPGPRNRVVMGPDGGVRSRTVGE